MKFIIKFLLILLILGLVLAAAGFFMGMNMEELRTFFDDDDSYGEQIVVTVEDEISALVIDAQTRHIKLTTTDLEVMTVKYYKHERDTYTISDATPGVYQLVQKERYQFFSFVRFKVVSKEILTIDIEIPSTWLLDLTLSTNIGEISLNYDNIIAFKNLELDSNTGSIYVKNVTIDSFLGDVDTGAITVINATVSGDLRAKTSTGKITLDDIHAVDFNLSTSTGAIQITGITGRDLKVGVSTGRVTATDVTLTGKIDLTTSTGDLILSDFTANSVILYTSTGEIKVTVNTLNLYKLDLKTSTGKVVVDGNNQGNRHTTSLGSIDLKATASTGDIKIIVQG
ncbi:MAG: DUF4097 family beta strand repeat-containing protein [Acholeplasmataceae bacterium]|nr:DUF4097 family beta strand repeat-containing protein [Acholeplasmataceae bacterium]